MNEFERANHQLESRVNEMAQDMASGSHLDLDHSPYNLYGVKYIDLVAPMAHHTAAEASDSRLDLDYSTMCFVWC